jgi:hypothetical protein
MGGGGFHNNFFLVSEFCSKLLVSIVLEDLVYDYHFFG